MNTMDPQAYIDGVISRDRRMMSKTIFNQNPEVKSRLRKISPAVEKGNTAPTVAAEELLFFLDKN